MTSTLSRPLRLPCGVVLPNRLAKAAMTEQMADPATNAPGDALVRLYERWAVSGAGVLLTGNVMIDRVCMENVRNVAVEDNRDLELLRRWAVTAQAKGAQLWMQISHAGRQSPKRVTRQPVAPSAVPFQRRSLQTMFGTPRALREQEILNLIASFARTAAIAKRAGFSGVQIHAAHGYLISQFLSPLINQRTDDWGGRPDNRMRFLLEVLRATRKEVGPAFPVSVKLNSADFQRGGFSEEDSMNVVHALDAEGVDLLEISGGNYENAAMVGRRDSTRKREAFFLDYTEKIRGLTRTPLMLTGGFRTAKAMAEAIDNGSLDVIGLARPLCVEPDLCSRMLEGTALAAAEVDIGVNIPLFDDLLQSFWYNHQMKRIARGLMPTTKTSPWLILVRGLCEQAIVSPFQRGRSY